MCFERGAELCRALWQAFTGDAVRSYAGLVEAVVRRYFARWDTGGEVKAYVQCKDLAFDVACAILLGMQLDVRAPPACTPAAPCCCPLASSCGARQTCCGMHSC